MSEGFIEPNEPGTDLDVLERIKDLLGERIEEVGDGIIRCFISLDPEPPIETLPISFITIAPANSTFNKEHFVGHGAFGLLEEGLTDVSYFTDIRLDAPAKAEAILKEAQRGLYRWKRKILTALTGQQLKTEGADGVYGFMSTLLRPTNCYIPENPAFHDDAGKKKIGITVRFETQFMWDSFV